MHPWTGQTCQADTAHAAACRGGMRLSQGSGLLAALLMEMGCDALAVMMALRVLHIRIRPVFVCFAAFFGTLVAFAALSAAISRPLGAALWLPTALGMMRIAAPGEKGIWPRIRAGMALLFFEGYLGGVMLALYGATGSLALAQGMSTAMSAAVFVIVLRAARERKRIRRVGVTCRIGQRTLAFEAMVDSGNTLRDYLTRRPVIVAGEALLRGMQGESLRLRLIFADTAGGRVMMQLVTPEETVLEFSGREMRVDAALAFSPALPGGAPALVPENLLG